MCRGQGKQEETEYRKRGGSYSCRTLGEWDPIYREGRGSEGKAPKPDTDDGAKSDLAWEEYKPAQSDHAPLLGTVHLPLSLSKGWSPHHGHPGPTASSLTAHSPAGPLCSHTPSCCSWNASGTPVPGPGTCFATYLISHFPYVFAQMHLFSEAVPGSSS